MTPAATPEALEQARGLIRHSLKVGAPGLTETARDAIVRSIMLKLEGKVLAPLLADLQRVTAERDEAREVVARCNNSFGSYSYHLNPHPAEQIEKVKWQARSEWQRAEDATAEAASLRAEVEAKDRALQQVKSWIDTDLPAGTSRAGTVHRVVTKALDRTALARAATAGEG